MSVSKDVKKFIRDVELNTDWFLYDGADWDACTIGQYAKRHGLTTFNGDDHVRVSDGTILDDRGLLLEVEKHSKVPFAYLWAVYTLSRMNDLSDSKEDLLYVMTQLYLGINDLVEVQND